LAVNSPHTEFDPHRGLLSEPLQFLKKQGKMWLHFHLEAELANLKSAIKRIRSNERKRVRNRIIRSRARSAVSNARESVQDPKGEEAVRKAIRELDRAAEKGVIHKNNAARRKSRLMRMLHTAKPKKASK
jgi:small subunit ribosomal protein S20